VPENGSANFLVGQPGRYLVLATQILGEESLVDLRDELRRHEKQMVSVVARDGMVETVTLRPVVLNMTDIGNQPSTVR
jgi:hypothetical protein